MTPLEILSGTFSVINGAIVFGQFVLKLSEVDGDTKTCISLLERVNRDVDAAERLRKLKYPAKGPKCRQHLRALEAIRDTKNAVHELGKLVYVAKNGHLGMKTRLKWVMSDKESFATREKMLHYCYATLLQVVTTMESRPEPDLDVLSKAPPPPYDEIPTKRSPMPLADVVSGPSQGFRVPNGPLPVHTGLPSGPKWETPSQRYLKKHSKFHFMYNNTAHVN
ncbi:hypothetical protein G7Y89_g9273 [Cudoniella acicularis]|uniref:Uncharacterized protein n=1 Tax=Cudoniella acicularis TaxID=354080 RepID=A0A8H4W222_9HELO|nr:hypothetical protein G7Y89_g9273 [Cudoniella acicularis]